MRKITDLLNSTIMKRLLKIIGWTIFLLIIVVIICFSIRSVRERIIYYYCFDGGLKHASCYVNDSTGHRVILIPLVHIGTEKFAAKLKTYLDELKEDGFVTFNEGILRTRMLSDTTKYMTLKEAFGLLKEEEDTMLLYEARLKERQINIRVPDWRDSIRQIPTYNPWLDKWMRNPKYVHINYERYGATTDKDYWVDYTLGDMLSRYEAKFGEVVLTDYDYATPFGCAYGRQDTTVFHHIIDYRLSFRDDNLMRRVVNAPFDKIAVVYGAGHMANFHFRFEDYGFRKDKDFKVPQKYR